MAASGVLAALAYKAVTGTPIVIDTGDAISALARSIGRSSLGCWLTQLLETVSLRYADHIVVRGTNHRCLLQNRGVESVTVIQDGVDPNQFRPLDASSIRHRHDLDDALVIGVLGSSGWNERLQTCYGWEMLDALHRLGDSPIKALMIGGGSGIRKLKGKARALGLRDRITFVGHVPYAELPSYLNAMDVCLSKQTNDVVGQVRTTGKLPLYMACGKYVLATRVGEAAHLLPDSMLVDYDGQKDPHYADRLANRLHYLLRNPEALKLGERNRDLAREHFDYDVLSDRMVKVLNRYLLEESRRSVRA